MAGLLGDGSDDPGQMANWNLVAGLLSPGSFGQGLGKGLAGYQSSLAASQDYQSKTQALAMQKLQFAAALRNQNLINDYLQSGMPGQGAAPSAPATAPGTAAMGQGAALGDVGPTNTNAARIPTAAPPSPSAPQQPQGMMFGLPANQAMPDLAFNGGKNIASLVAGYNKPESMRPGGYSLTPSGQLQQFPQVPEGFTSNRGPDGQWHIVPVDGGPAALAASSNAKAAGPAGLKQVQVIGPDNKTYTVFANQLPGWAGATGQGSPAPAAGPSAVQVDPTAQASQDAQALALAQQEVKNLQVKLALNPSDKQAARDLVTVQGNVTRMQAGGSPVPNLGIRSNVTTPSPAASGNGLPPGAVPTGLAPGTVTTADESAKDAVGNYNTLHTFATSSAPRNIGLLQSIQQLADKTLVGPGSDKAQFVNGVLNTLGITPGADQAQNYQIMTKNLNMLVGSQRMGAAGGGSDALQSLLQASNPNNKEMNGPALKEASDELIAWNRMMMAKDKVMPNPLSTSTQAYQQAETAFSPFADPRLWQVEHAQSDQERARIISLMPASERTKFLNTAKQARQLGVLN